VEGLSEGRRKLNKGRKEGRSWYRMKRKQDKQNIVPLSSKLLKINFRLKFRVFWDVVLCCHVQVGNSFSIIWHSNVMQVHAEVIQVVIWSTCCNFVPEFHVDNLTLILYTVVRFQVLTVVSMKTRFGLLQRDYMAQYPRVLSLYVVVSLSVFQFDLREIGAATFPEDINKGKLDSVSICKQVICFFI
jgi:hypothetical protein